MSFAYKLEIIMDNLAKSQFIIKEKTSPSEGSTLESKKKHGTVGNISNFLCKLGFEGNILILWLAKIVMYKDRVGFLKKHLKRIPIYLD